MVSLKDNSVFCGILIVVECIVWGLGNPLTKIGLEVMPAFYCIAMRFILAFLLFMLFFGKYMLKKIRKAFIKPCLIIGIFTAISFISCSLAFKYTLATTAGFLISLAIVFTPFLSYCIAKKRIEKENLLVITIVVLGLYCLCGGGSGFHFGLGELLAIISSVSMACMLEFSARYLLEIDPLLVCTVQSGVTGIICFFFALGFEEFPGWSGIPPIGWGVIIYLAVGCTFLAYILQNVSLRNLSATYVALIFCSEPIFTAIFSYGLLGETLTYKGLIGSGFIFVGIVLASVLPLLKIKYKRKRRVLPHTK